MQISNRKSRVIALLTGATLLSATLIQAAPASANESKTWKYGAVGLGVLGAYMLSKDKKVEGAAALGGAYYAYKKGEDERKEDKRDNRRDRRNNRRDDRREGRWNDRGNDGYYGGYGNSGYGNYGYGNSGNYNSGNYDTYLR